MGERPLPLMQQPDFILRNHKHVLARRVLVGDIVLEKEHGRSDEKWTVEEVDVQAHMTYVKYSGWHKKIGLGLNEERVWIARVDEEWMAKKRAREAAATE